MGRGRRRAHVFGIERKEKRPQRSASLGRQHSRPSSPSNAAVRVAEGRKKKKKSTEEVGEDGLKVRREFIFIDKEGGRACLVREK